MGAAFLACRVSLLVFIYSWLLFSSCCCQVTCSVVCVLECGCVYVCVCSPSVCTDICARESFCLPCQIPCEKWLSLFFQLRLEALHQILVLLSGMEEKGSSTPSGGSRQGPAGFPSSSLLTSVRLQFLAGCFGLGTVGHAGAKGESIRLHHYQVKGC